MKRLRERLDAILFLFITALAMGTGWWLFTRLPEYTPPTTQKVLDPVRPLAEGITLAPKENFDDLWKRGDREDPFSPYRVKRPVSVVPIQPVKSPTPTVKPITSPTPTVKPVTPPPPQPYKIPVRINAINYTGKMVLLQDKKTNRLQWCPLGGAFDAGGNDRLQIVEIQSGRVVLDSPVGGRLTLTDPLRKPSAP
ncbi:MAG: hypothetical protein V1809_16000 [Planctomycetota bacterium]